MHQFPLPRNEKDRWCLFPVFYQIPLRFYAILSPNAVVLWWDFLTLVSQTCRLFQWILTWKIFWFFLFAAYKQWAICTGRGIWLKTRFIFFSLKLRQLKCYHGNIQTKEIEIDGFPSTFTYFSPSKLRAERKFRHVIFSSDMFATFSRLGLARYLFKHKIRISHYKKKFSVCCFTFRFMQIFWCRKHCEMKFFEAFLSSFVRPHQKMKVSFLSTKFLRCQQCIKIDFAFTVENFSP